MASRPIPPLRPLRRPLDPPASQDDAIRATNDDATVSKLSAVNLGYLHDPFVHFFVRQPVRRSPLINRGRIPSLLTSLGHLIIPFSAHWSYVRNAALNQLITKFLAAGGTERKKQIVSLGCGFDTRYFLFKSRSPQIPNQAATAPSAFPIHKYFEIDFPELTANKSSVLRAHREFTELWGSEATNVMNVGASHSPGGGGTELYAEDYVLLAGDLRQWESKVVPRLFELGLDMNLPTLFISECVLIYLDPVISDAIIRWATDNLHFPAFVLYEQILPGDSFGEVMIRNLQARNIELKGIQACPTLESQRRRFLDRGWTFAEAVDIDTVHDRMLARGEMARISRLEMLDELEEWRLLAQHYCIVWAYRVPPVSSSSEDSHLFDAVRFEEHEHEGAGRVPHMFPRG
ncbi:S-adenosyl-L-methionine-dependent methyltransferase [Jimgerdemannia flammicorona]|uniref:Leucine carboxyl methyltransferase 1 n=1 Tax=Jimgerdemannia flammicorona TaxID=994334 RepID=A0A433QMT8_9FUNG|nr:S-adenosyl-L-methionine-dependent methyltransferase [Jimgerdemannia flammicorona]